jgi:hypothetical protein
MGGTAAGSDGLKARRCRSLRFLGQSEQLRCMMPFLFGKRLETVSDFTFAGDLILIIHLLK